MQERVRFQNKTPCPRVVCHRSKKDTLNPPELGAKYEGKTMKETQYEQQPRCLVVPPVCPVSALIALSRVVVSALPAVGDA